MLKSLIETDSNDILRSTTSQMSKQQNSFGNYKLLSDLFKKKICLQRSKIKI